jgi:hypothetical protein
VVPIPTLHPLPSEIELLVVTEAFAPIAVELVNPFATDELYPMAVADDAVDPMLALFPIDTDCKREVELLPIATLSVPVMLTE